METEPSNAQPTQHLLLRRVRNADDRQAWSEFHRIYAPLITSFLRRMGLTHADTEDAIQEIMLVAHQGLRSGKYDRSRGSFRGWLYGIARNKALVAHRNRRRPSRAQAPVSESGVDLLGGIEDRSDETDRVIWEQEWRYAMLAEALRHVRLTLSEKVYEAFLRYGVHRRPVEDVAAELGTSTSTVYVYKARALEAIRRWIAEYEGETSEERV